VATLVLTVIGDDRAGLVNSLAEIVAAHGGNWGRSQLAEQAGKFAGLVTITVPDLGVTALTAALEPLSGLLDVTVQRADDITRAHEGRTFRLQLVGGDRPGIVAEITGVLTRHRVNIDFLQTSIREAPMSGGQLFEATAELTVPSDADPDAVRAELETLADELMVDLQLGE
jgi:glycine cleavage system regulatory protein